MDFIDSISRASQIVFLRVDLESGKITSNKLWRERWGYVADEEVFYSEFSARQSSQYRELFRSAFEQIQTTHSPVDETLEASAEAGTWYRFHFEPVFNERHELFAIDITNVDVSKEVEQQRLLESLLEQQTAQRRALAAEITKFDSFCDQFELIYWRFNVVDETIEYNATFAKRWGLDKPDKRLTLDEFRSMLPEDTFQTHKENIERTISTKAPLNSLFKGLSGRQKGRWFDLRYWPVFDTQQNVIAVNLANIEVSDLIDAKVTVETTLQRQKELFAIIGHELRTPVATIKMLSQDQAVDADAYRNQVSDIASNLLDVLEDMRVAVSPERALETRVAEASPAEVIRRALLSVEALATNAGKVIDQSGLKYSVERYQIATQALRQIVVNLVKNAVVHAQGTQIAVSFEVNQVEDNQSLGILIVEDDGQGISQKAQSSMFQPFTQGETVKDGSGLGLYIVKQLAEKLNGELNYATSNLGGACFTLTFPMSVVAKDIEIEPAAIPVVSLQGMRILLAEDEATLRLLTERMLTKQGAVVTACVDGDDAFRAFDSAKFDLVITDLMMPNMDGHELTSAIRASGAQTPIIAVTAAVLGKETDKFYDEGANAVLAKPLVRNELLEALTKAKFSERSN